MLGDIRGRALIRVGVAYGSDTEKVRYILTQVAEENELVVKDGTSPKPMVLFRGFGDSSLDFELRVHLYDVDRRLSTISNINFAIDRAFRDEGIEIPFPQRDVHLKTVPDKHAED
jgi:small-conductance mechanosensitive channel